MSKSIYKSVAISISRNFNRNGFRKAYAQVVEAIAGTEQDFTQGSLGKAIFLLSVPMVLEMLMESVFALADIIFVAKLGADAIATVGLTESIITIVYAIGMGLSTATTAMVARRIGEKKPRAAALIAGQAVVTALFASVLIAIPGILFASDILQLMGTDAATAQRYSGYTQWMLGGNAVIMLLFTINAVFRSAGDAAISMRVLLLANVANIILDPILIFGWEPIPALGITGAAIATNIGRGLAVAYQVYLLFGGRSRVKPSLSSFIPRFNIIGQLVKLSLGGIGQMFIATSSWIGLMRIVSIYGNEVIAGYTVAIRLIVFSLLPSAGISNAAATLVGQNLGAGKPHRAERSVYFTGWANMIFLGVVGLLFVITPSSFVGLLTKDPVVIAFGSTCLRIASYGFIAYGLGMVLISAINGAGDTITPTKINFFCYWVFEIPLAWMLAVYLDMREEGVFYSIFIAETAMTAVAFIVFRRGKWKLRKV